MAEKNRAVRTACDFIKKRSIDFTRQLTIDQTEMLSFQQSKLKIDITNYDLKKVRFLQRLFRRYILRVRLRRLVSTFSTTNISKEMLHKRNKALKEVLSSEQIYVDNLKLVCERFLHPLKVFSKRDSLALSEIDAIFMNIKDIKNAHSRFLKELRVRLQNWPIIHYFGDIFKQLESKLEIYLQYFLSFDKALETLSACRQRPEFAEFLKEHGEPEQTNGLYLNSYLIMPIQRMPRYKMLLEVRELWIGSGLGI
eukprot:TRINITY_DN13177_c0_g1_i1.p1 TRINITY_DN13177_c0_g1~~TRINITY_DN13177_c0_g1_i1.p1  ORF type:complete len:287 (+),score=38.80 TRINITY_DN13177_c0_g1_i1:105-863(+)